MYPVYASATAPLRSTLPRGVHLALHRKIHPQSSRDRNVLPHQKLQRVQALVVHTASGRIMRHGGDCPHRRRLLPFSSEENSLLSIYGNHEKMKLISRDSARLQERASRGHSPKGRCSRDVSISKSLSQVWIHIRKQCPKRRSGAGTFPQRNCTIRSPWPGAASKRWRRNLPKWGAIHPLK